MSEPIQKITKAYIEDHMKALLKTPPSWPKSLLESLYRHATEKIGDKEVDLLEMQVPITLGVNLKNKCVEIYVDGVYQGHASLPF